MATTPIRVDLDLNQNEIQNVVIQNLASAPQNPIKGQIYFNTTNHNYYGYKNNSWVLLDSQGATYTGGTGINITGTTINVDTTIASKTDIGDGVLTINCNSTTIGSFNANATSASTITISVPTTATEVGAIPSSEKGANSGVATLGSDGKVPSSQLPSYVDDVIDAYIVSGATALSAGWLSATDGGSALTPETGKIYVVLTSGTYQNKSYRWSGTTYVDISSGNIQKFTANNPALTASSGVCTWSITNSIGSVNVTIQIFEISTGTQVMAEVLVSASTITIKMNSSSNISADTYRAVILG